MVYKFGKRWSLIQRHMKDRSENQIKNQYNAIMRNLKKEKISSEDETKLLQNIIQNPNQDMQKLIDGFLHEVRTKRDQNEPKITQKKIKMEVKNNLIIKEQNQMIKQIPEIKQNLEVQCKKSSFYLSIFNNIKFILILTIIEQFKLISNILIPYLQFVSLVAF
ncbi:unnamed protein product [Paramecium sonneborni]|uniref:HTH myb-type domain-containing protein n=1 Tax=Paramecium sonneborni TaxID=65129 RepID=A0A8S1LRF2_9CILI|nr:unnamed protein product [Paramecium sonneborni]